MGGCRSRSPSTPGWDDTGTQTTTRRQERACREYCAARGWEVAAVFEDVDYSAYRGELRRPAFEAMCRAVGDGEVAGVLVWKLDRLVRRARDFERFWAVCEKAGVSLASVTEPIDTSTDLGLGLVRILVTFAGLESATKSVRLRSRARELAELGEPARGGRRVFGYTADWSAVVPAEAAMVIEGAERVLAGETPTAIAQDWNRQGLATATGATWATGTVRGLLIARRFVGERTYKGTVVAPGRWPAVLDADTGRRLRARLDDPGRTRLYRQRYLLSGLVECGRCGRHMTACGQATSRGPGYRCSQANGGCVLTISVPPLDTLVTRLVLAHIAEGAAPEPWLPVEPDTDDLRAATADGLRALANDYYLHHDISRDEYLHARRQLLRRWETDRQARDPSRRARPRSGLTATALRTGWPDLTQEQRHQIMRAEIERVIVNPAPRPGRFNPSRVTVVFHYDGATPGERTATGTDPPRPARVRVRSRLRPVAEPPTNLTSIPDGTSVADIAASYGVTVQVVRCWFGAVTVHEHVARLGRGHDPLRLHDRSVEWLWERYVNQGCSLTKIGAEIGATRERISLYISLCGIPRRTKRQQSRRKRADRAWIDAQQGASHSLGEFAERIGSSPRRAAEIASTRRSGRQQRLP